LATLRLNKIRIGAIAAAAALSLTMSACGGDDGDGDGGSGGGSGDTLNIGFMGDLSGPDSAIVIPPFQGASLAIEQYNATNPAKKLKLIKYDTQGKPEQASQLAPKAIKDDKIVAMIGPAFSGESAAVGSVLNQGKVPSITASATNPQLSKNGWTYWHRLVATDAAQGAQVTEAMINATKPKKAYVINGKKEYSVGIGDVSEQTFKAKGINVQRDEIDETASDYSSTVTKVKAFAPDVIFYGGYYSEGGKLLKQLRDGGVSALWAAGDGSLDAKLIEAAGPKQAENALLGCPCFIPFGEQTDPTLVKFVNDYKAKYGADPAIYSTEGFDAATAFIEAIKGGNDTGEKINNFLKTYSAKGVSKEVKWDPQGELATTTIHLYQVQGGALKWLGTAAEAKPQT
jgi:branched-chain amino acid transport system substrate-binding protein